MHACPLATTTGAGVGHHGPYESFSHTLKEKKAPFFALLKKLRETKNSDLPIAQINATRKSLNSDLHKLLGDEKFHSYQAIHRQQAQHNLATKATKPPRRPRSRRAAAAAARLKRRRPIRRRRPHRRARCY